MIQMAHRIVLTEKCNKKCPHCFNAEQRRAAEHMDIDKLERFWVVNQKWLEDAELKIMGGEPTIHPEFLRLADLGILLFDKVTLFTNGTKLNIIEHPDILASHWTDKFEFVINGYTFDFEEWGRHSKYFKRIGLHFVVPLGNDVQKTIDKVYKCMSIPQARFILSGDTQVDIFDDATLDQYRNNYIHFMQSVIPRLKQNFIPYNFDHTFPACFWTQRMIDELNKYNIGPIHLQRQSCCDTILGLLDTNFDLWYCNQTRIKIGNVLHKDGSPRNMQDILSTIQMAPRIKEGRVSNYQHRCRNCPSLPTCKTACWYKHAIPLNHTK